MAHESGNFTFVVDDDVTTLQSGDFVGMGSLPSHDEIVKILVNDIKSTDKDDGTIYLKKTPMFARAERVQAILRRKYPFAIRDHLSEANVQRYTNAVTEKLSKLAAESGAAAAAAKK
jgi:hypothetical protein